MMWTLFQVIKDTYDKSWVEAEMLKYYTDTSIVSELSSGTMALLISSKGDDELQNEVSSFFPIAGVAFKSLILQLSVCLYSYALLVWSPFLLCIRKIKLICT